MGIIDGNWPKIKAGWKPALVNFLKIQEISRLRERGGRGE
jgi:hypothetical protein